MSTLRTALERLHTVCAAMDCDIEGDRPSEAEYQKAMADAERLLRIEDGSSGESITVGPWNPARITSFCPLLVSRAEHWSVAIQSQPEPAVIVTGRKPSREELAEVLAYSYPAWAIEALSVLVELHWKDPASQPAPAARPMPAIHDEIQAARTADADADEWPDAWAFKRGWQCAEAHHRIGSQPTAPAVPARHVGDSRFESWFSEYDMKHKGTKQQMRDAYAAGMGDTAAVPADRDVFVVNLMRHTTLTKAQARALIAHWLDGVEPDAALFAPAAVPEGLQWFTVAENGMPEIGEAVVGGLWYTDPWLKPECATSFMWGQCRVLSDTHRDFKDGKRWHTFGPSHNDITHWARFSPPLASAPTSTKGGV
jgi:hypothetical protein